MAEELLSISKLKKTYLIEEVKTEALRDANFTVKTGEFVAIMGPSGSGKSTLLHLLGLLDRASEGTYTFLGKSIEAYSDRDLARVRNNEIGFVFQQFFLLPRMSVIENVMLPLSYSDVPKDAWEGKATKVLESVGLGHRINYLPTRLSGGEKQRVAIARALVTEPKVLFADEPTGNLDSVSGAQVMEIFDRLHKEGKTVILITHDEDIATHAERLIRVKDGKVVSDEKI